MPRKYTYPCSVHSCTLPARARGLCMNHYAVARAAGELPAKQGRRPNPSSLVSGTAAYARWWKANNRDRVLEQKRRARARKNAADPAYQQRQQLRAERLEAKRLKREEKSNLVDPFDLL
jgi:hypothetical protein